MVERNNEKMQGPASTVTLIFTNHLHIVFYKDEACLKMITWDGKYNKTCVFLNREVPYLFIVIFLKKMFS